MASLQAILIFSPSVITMTTNRSYINARNLPYEEQVSWKPFLELPSRTYADHTHVHSRLRLSRSASLEPLFSDCGLPVTLNVGIILIITPEDPEIQEKKM